MDLPLLTESLTAVARRHAALRCSFPDPAVTAFAECAAPEAVCWPVASVDLTAADPSRRAELERAALLDVQRPFDPGSSPLLRGTLLRYPDHHLLALAVDHMIFDGASIPALLRDLEHVYRHLSRGGAREELGDEISDFSTFATAERRWLHGADGAAALDYWIPRWTGMGPFPRLPLPEGHHGDSAAAASPWRRDLPLATLTEAGARLGVGPLTPFMALATALFTAIHEASGVGDLGLVFAVSRRDRPGAENDVGYYNNRLLLRVDIRPGMSPAAVAEEVRAATLAAVRHATMPFEVLTARIQPDQGSRRPSVPYLFLNVVPRPEPPRLADLRVEFCWLDLDDVFSQFPGLTVTCETSGESASLTCWHNAARYRQADVAALLNRAVGVLTV